MKYSCETNNFFYLNISSKQKNDIFKVLVELRIEKLDARPTLNGNEILSLEMQY